MGTPQQRISPSKESRSRQIRKLKTQENQDLPTAFLQNRILARVKSQRQINRFRILHGRLISLARSSHPSVDRKPSVERRSWREPSPSVLHGWEAEWPRIS